jgi:hypothetical protein
MSGLRIFSIAVLCCCLEALPAAAQDSPLPAPAPPPANLAFVEGIVAVVHEGVADRGDAGAMIVDGDLVRTGDGRAEIVFVDGTLLHLDRDTELEMLSPLRLRLRGGRVALRVSPAATSAYAIDTQAASLKFDARGEYGVTVDARSERLDVTVARGVVEVEDAGSRTVVRGGEMATVLGAGARVSIQTFNSARFDAFDRWADERTNGFAAAVSSRQLPSELRPYAPTFDNYGRWDYLAPYGNVWFPSVGAEWRPYYTGSWRQTRYGWTWIGNDPWAWPTHHYGRWGFTGASWYWMPNRVWGPAWVSWAFVPGYVSWSPLGWDGRAVIGFSSRIGDHQDFRPRYDPWRSWTIVPRDTFGRRGLVRAHAIDPSRLPEHTRRLITNAVPRGTVVMPGAAGNARVRRETDLAVPRATLSVVGAPVAPADIRRSDDLVRDDARRGIVRNPTYVLPPSRAVVAPRYRAAPVAPASSPDAAPPAALLYRPGVGSRAVERGAAERRDAPQPRDRDAGASTVPAARGAYAPPPQSSERPSPRAYTGPPPREDRNNAPPSAGRIPSRPIGATPRAESPRERTATPPPATRDSSGSGAHGGAERRRPPK